jgi:hypothetical protein
MCLVAHATQVHIMVKSSFQQIPKNCLYYQKLTIGLQFSQSQHSL